MKLNMSDKKYKNFRETYKYASFSMVTSFVYPNPKYIKHRLIGFGIMTLSVLPLIIFITLDLIRYAMESNIIEIIQQTNIFGPFLAILFKVLIQCYCNQSAFEIIHEIDRDYALYNDLSASYQAIVDESIHNNLAYTEKGWFILVSLVVFIFPVMALAKNTFYLFKGDHRRYMVHEIRIPYVADEDRYNSPLYEFMFLYMIYCCFLYLFGFAGYDSFYGLSTNHACLKMEIYCKMFQDAVHADSDEIRGRIIDVIKEQNRLYRFVDIIQNTFSLWLGMILMATMIQLCNCMYILIDGAGFDLKYLIFVIGSILHIFLPCLYSAKLKDKSVETATVIYCGGWERIHRPEIRKMVQFMIVRSQKHLELVAFNVKVLDMELFVSILQASYSVYTLLRS